MAIYIGIKIMIDDDVRFEDILKKKCKSTIDGQFSHKLFNQNLSESLILYYVLIKNYRNTECTVFIEKRVFDNEKLLEYSLLVEENILVNFEVKTLSCDPFIEDKIPVKDGLELVKLYFSNDKECEFPTATKIKSKYNGFKNNLRKIETKFTGENLTDYITVNIGVVVVNFSPSFEEFISYLLHPKYGIIKSYSFIGTDAIVILSLDDKNDLLLENIYQLGYVQTYLINKSDLPPEYVHSFRVRENIV